MKHILFLTLLLTSTISQAAFTSEYTDLNQCKTLSSSENDPDAEIDYFTSVCPGRDGFDVRLDGGDSRSWLSLVTTGTEHFVAEYLGAHTAGFFTYVIGSKVEWRYSNGKLIALIIRMGGQDPEDYTKSVTSLTVIRLDKNNPSAACTIKVINAQQAKANEKARAAADNLQLKCN